jgi:hypothetical protein
MWLFEGFSAGLPKLWTASTGWASSNDGDTVRVTASGGANDPVEFVTLPLTSQGRLYTNFTISASFTIDSATGNTGPEIGIDLIDDTSRKSVLCSLWEDSGNGANPGSNPNQGLYERKSDGTINSSVDKFQSFSWKPGVAYTLTMTHVGTTNTCKVESPGAQPMTLTLTSSVAPSNGGDSSLFAFGSTVRFDWVFVAGTP